MSLEEFYQLYLPLLNLIISSAVLISLIILIKQYYSDNHWKRLQSSYNFIGIDEEMNLQERLYNKYEELQIYDFPEVCVPLNEEEVNLITKDREATLITNMFLNHFQNLCTAFSSGLISTDIFYSVHANRLCWWYTILRPYIDRRKKDYLNENIWADFEKISIKSIKKKKFSLKKEALTNELKIKEGLESE